MSAQQQQVCAHCQVVGHSRATCSQHLAVIGTAATASQRSRACGSCLGDPRRRALPVPPAAAPPAPAGGFVPPLAPQSSANLSREVAELRRQLQALQNAASQREVAGPVGGLFAPVAMLPRFVSTRPGQYRNFVHHVRAAAVTGTTSVVERFDLSATTLTAAAQILPAYRQVTIANVVVQVLMPAVTQEGRLCLAAGAAREIALADHASVMAANCFASVGPAGTATIQVPDVAEFGVSHTLDASRRPDGAPSLRLAWFHTTPAPTGSPTAGAIAARRPDLRIVVTLLLRDMISA